MIVVPSLSMWGKFELSGVSPDTAGVYRPTVFADGPSVFDHQNLPTEPVGTTSLRFRNLVEGSRVRVETVSTQEYRLEFIASAESVQIHTVPLFSLGSPLNELRVKVRKASEAPAYKPFETQVTAQAGSVTVYIFQEPDE